MWSDCESTPENLQSFLFERAQIIIIFGNKRIVWWHNKRIKVSRQVSICIASFRSLNYDVKFFGECKMTHFMFEVKYDIK